MIFYTNYLSDFKKDPKDPRQFDYLITFQYHPTRLGKLLGFKSFINEYVGNCTVWNNAKTGKRCSTFQESHLCDIWNFKRRETGLY